MPAFEGKTIFRQMVLLKKRDDFTLEEFHQYWSEVHGPLITKLKVFKEKVLRYEQLYPHDMAGVLVPEAFKGYDGVAVLDYASKQDQQAMAASAEWRETAGPDTGNFANPKEVGRIFWEVQVHAEK